MFNFWKLKNLKHFNIFFKGEKKKKEKKPKPVLVKKEKEKEKEKVSSPPKAAVEPPESPTKSKGTKRPVTEKPMKKVECYEDVKIDPEPLMPVSKKLKPDRPKTAKVYQKKFRSTGIFIACHFLILYFYLNYLALGIQFMVNSWNNKNNGIL